MESINMLYDIVKHYTKGNKIELDIANKVARIEQDLEILDILKEHLYIQVINEKWKDKTYSIVIEGKGIEYNDYTYMYVNGKEKDLIKEWLAKG